MALSLSSTSSSSAASPAIRCVSLLPAASDAIHAMGLSHLLVARSHECDAPTLRHLPSITHDKLLPTPPPSHLPPPASPHLTPTATPHPITSGGTSAAAAKVAPQVVAVSSMEAGSRQQREASPLAGQMTPMEVHMAASTAKAAAWEVAFGLPPGATQLVEWHLSPYRVDVDRLLLLDPTVVVTQVQEQGGLISEATMEAALTNLLRHPIRIVHLDPRSLSHVMQDVERVAAALGQKARGMALALSMRQRMDVVKGMCAGRRRKRVVCVQWVEPLFLAGAWVPEIIRLAGGVEVGGRSGREEWKGGESEKGAWRSGKDGEEGGEGGETSAVETTWEELEKERVDALVLAICGCDLQASRRMIQDMVLIPSAKKRESESCKMNFESSSFNAMRRMLSKVPCVVVNGVKLFSRGGPSLVESVEVMAEVLHSEIQQFGHKNKGWEMLSIP